MTEFLYELVLSPLVQIIEFAFRFSTKVFDNIFLSICGISITVFFLTFPLYYFAEKWQESERAIQKRLAPMIANIKAVFKGDERYMLLCEYYRQEHYSPVFALRNSFGILIQVPFFLAAYSYLSHLPSLKGVSLLFVQDMSMPDSLWTVNGFSINVLPIIMTLINCVSGTIYTKGFLLKDKLQVYGIAAIFLLLLYNSASGLVFYWILNNILSLLKNIFYKIKKPIKVLYILIACLLLIFIAYLLFINTGGLAKRLFVASIFAFIIFTPFWLKCYRYIKRVFLITLEKQTAQRNIIYVLSCVTLAILTGACIPSAVMASSPTEFSFIDFYSSPLIFLYFSFLKSIAFFVFWTVCTYFLFNDKLKTLLAAILPILTVIAFVNAYLFVGDYGMISNLFTFNTTNVLSGSMTVVLLNIFINIAVVLLLLLLFQKIRLKFIISGIGILCTTFAVFSLYNIIKIDTEYKQLEKLQSTSQSQIHSVDPIFSLSKDKPNIIIVMADCAISGYVKPIFEEHPQLQKQFDGFTLYPNTISFAGHTIMATSAIWGGYEYTPKAMNERSTVPMVEKHNEALLVLPRLMSGSGYKVTVTDPSFANWSWIADTSIYNGYENITAFNTISRYSSLWYMKNKFGNGNVTGDKIKRNVFWFSMLKIMPVGIRKYIYDDGWYWNPDRWSGSIAGFINSYSVLDFLPELTDYSSKTSSALFITNEATHDLTYLQYPNYIPIEEVTNKGNGVFSDSKYYHVDSAFFLRFGEWLDELKKNNVYDNTKIIIVSDHGASINAKIADTEIQIPGVTRENYNPVLMVKDFFVHGELQTDMSFMTCADVPVIAAKDIIENPKNPFTGKSLNAFSKNDESFITTNHRPLIHHHNKYTFAIRNNQWIHVRDNIFDEKNWEQADLQIKF
ncbi:MAG: YidC/Oxa1 family membrane protein insertase [Termitinemataceae bacterium]|nr:MAG: YidC/Oxa1 family membrane protein insertase [Termitinemataceae bacterium]